MSDVQAALCCELSGKVKQLQEVALVENESAVAGCTRTPVLVPRDYRLDL